MNVSLTDKRRWRGRRRHRVVRHDALNTPLPHSSVDENESVTNETSRCFSFSFLSLDCYFGRTKYELEDVWNPDLGPPFGVMYCIRCECHPVSVFVCFLPSCEIGLVS